MRIDHLGYALKDKNGRYYSSCHQSPVKRLKDCDTFTLKDAKYFFLKWNSQGGYWLEIVTVGLTEYKK